MICASIWQGRHHMWLSGSAAYYVSYSLRPSNVMLNRRQDDFNMSAGLNALWGSSADIPNEVAGKCMRQDTAIAVC